LAACVHAPQVAPVARSVRLLAAAASMETNQRTQTRPDIEIDTRDFDRTPHVVATGETPLVSADGAEVLLAGDEAGTVGLQVDNCILLEVLSASGQVLGRAVIGYTEPVIMGKEQLDLLGRRAFIFEPGEVVLTALVPERGPFRLRATVLDYFGEGRVSDVFVRVVPKARAEDDLRAP
jgi:hypothetical protein